MEIKELKSAILKNRLPHNLLIIVAENNKFLADQYINYIIEHNAEKVKLVNSLYDATSSALAFVMNTVEHLNILRTDVFSEVVSDYSTITDTIVVCNSVDKSVEAAVEQYIIKLPKSEDWQVKDYIRIVCNGLDESDVAWLYEMTGGDTYKIANELDKIKLFDKDKQTNVLTQLHYERGTDLYKKSTFDIIDNIIAYNRGAVLESLQHRDCIDLSGFFTITLLLNKFKQLYFVHYGPGMSYDEIGLKSEKQLWYIKNHSPRIQEAKLIYLIEFLSGLDEKVKSGKLDCPGVTAVEKDNTLVDYVLCRVLTILGGK